MLNGFILPSPLSQYCDEVCAPEVSQILRADALMTIIPVVLCLVAFQRWIKISAGEFECTSEGSESKDHKSHAPPEHCQGRFSHERDRNLQFCPTICTGCVNRIVYNGLLSSLSSFSVQPGRDHPVNLPCALATSCSVSGCHM